MSPIIEAPTLRGKLVTLRNIDPEKDSYPFFEIMLDQKMHEWTNNTVPLNRNDTLDLLQLYVNLDHIIAWSVISNETKEMIGTFWISPSIMNDKLIITDAQRIGRSYWRKGLTTEARILAYRYAFAELGADEVLSAAWKENINSCSSMEKFGFQLIKSELQLFQKTKNNHIFHTYRLKLCDCPYLSN